MTMKLANGSVPILLAMSLGVASCANQQDATLAAETMAQTLSLPAANKVEVRPASDVDWQKLNPARGDASPGAATLWGDRGASVATGFLVRFADGFSSPPHIHNVSYRAVVISGLVHNDDPNADAMWMPPGSFWTQPKGAAHITAAMGETIAYVEIDDGPYLVHPADEAFATEEKPINVDASNIVWIDAKDGWYRPAESASPAQIALLWGDPLGDESGGVFVDIPAGSNGMMYRPNSAAFRAIVVAGSAALGSVGGPEATAIEPGSSVSVGSGAVPVQCDGAANCLFYLHVRPSQGP